MFGEEQSSTIRITHESQLTRLKGLRDRLQPGKDGKVEPQDAVTVALIEVVNGFAAFQDQATRLELEDVRPDIVQKVTKPGSPISVETVDELLPDAWKRVVNYL